MNVIEAINARRAVRAYSPRTVEEATVKFLLRAAVRAPSALNEQPWIFAVAQSREQLRRWSDRAKALLLDRQSADPKAQHALQLADPAFDIFYDAGTLVVIGSRESSPHADANCWLAAENLMLAACECGLGSCPVGFAVPLLNTREVLEQMRFPPSAVAVAPIIIGYPRAETPLVRRADPQVLSWSR